mgnify:CR=1 FL=1
MVPENPKGVATDLPWNQSPGLQEAKMKKAQRKIVNEGEAHVFKEAVMVLVAENAQQQDKITSLTDDLGATKAQAKEQSAQIQYLVQKNTAQQSTIDRHGRVYATLAAQRRHLLKAVIRGRGFKDEGFWVRFKNQALYQQQQLRLQHGVSSSTSPVAAAAAGSAAGGGIGGLGLSSRALCTPPRSPVQRAGTAGTTSSSTAAALAPSAQRVGDLFATTESDDDEEADEEGRALLRKAVEWAELQLDAVLKVEHIHASQDAAAEAAAAAAAASSSAASSSLDAPVLSSRSARAKKEAEADANFREPLLVEVLSKEGRVVGVVGGGCVLGDCVVV